MRLFPVRQRILLTSVAAGVLFLFLFISYGERDSRKGPLISRASSYIEGLKIVNRKNGVDAWIITARRADLTRDETMAEMDSVTMDIRKEGVTVKAGSGTYNIKTRDLCLENSVTIRARGSLIETDALSWSPSGGLLASEGRVLMKGDRFTIEGEGLTAPDESRLKMRNVRAIFF